MLQNLKQWTKKKEENWLIISKEEGKRIAKMNWNIPKRKLHLVKWGTFLNLVTIQNKKKKEQIENVIEHRLNIYLNKFYYEKNSAMIGVEK